METESAAAILADYLDEDEAATQLNVSKTTLRRWRVERKGPPVTFVGRTPYYSRKTLRAWVAAQERPAERIHQSRKFLPA
jgi:Helix-turn-helix domain